MTILYLPDTQVDDALDLELRDLLSVCFGDAFREKRYHYELPAHRWLVRDEGKLVAHLAIHEKTFEHEGEHTLFLGVAEVCVAPSHRGRGLVRAMLREAERAFPATPFAILLGDKGVYGSSGYAAVHNVYFPYHQTDRPADDVLMKPLGDKAWPTGQVTIEGPSF